MTFQRFTGNNAALLLIDHQVGTMGWVTSATFDEMKRNTLILAKAARILKLPTVLTSSMEEAAQGPLLGELETTFAARTESLLQGDHTDLDVEIQVLRDRLKLET